MSKTVFYTHAPTTHAGVNGDVLIAKAIRDNTNDAATARYGDLGYDLWDDEPEKAEVAGISVYRVTIERLDNETLQPVASEGFDVV